MKAPTARFLRWIRSRAKRPGPAGPQLPPDGILYILYVAAVLMIIFVVMAATVASFAESYRGLYEWAGQHGYGGFWKAAWPLQVDSFIWMGELALFIAILRKWRRLSRLLAWTATIIGLVVSVAGNVGHVHSHIFTTQATAAVPPLAAAFSLAVGLGVLKQIVAARKVPDSPGTVSAPSFSDAQTAAAEALARSIAGGNALSQNQLMTRFRLNRPEAQEVRQRVLAQTPNGSSPEPAMDAVGEH